MHITVHRFSVGLQKKSDVTTIINYSPQHLPPENSSFLERSFCCRFRCLLDNSSGFLVNTHTLIHTHIQLWFGSRSQDPPPRTKSDLGCVLFPHLRP